MKCIYIGTQPILNRSGNISGAEVLERNGFSKNYFSVGEERLVLDNFLTIINHPILRLNKKLFSLYINMDEQDINFVLKNRFDLTGLTIELLEHLEPSEHLLKNICKLKSLGAKIALDDFEYSHRWLTLIPMVDIIKIDVLAHSEDAIRDVMSIIRMENPNVIFLAEKIESKRAYLACINNNFDLFQGYYLSFPSICLITL